VPFIVRSDTFSRKQQLRPVCEEVRLRREIRGVSRENADVIRECFARFSERDVDGFLALVHPDVSWLPANVVLEGRKEPHRGHAGIRNWFEEVTAKGRYLVTMSSAVADENDRLLIPAFVKVESDEPSHEAQSTLVWYLFELEDGRVRRLDTFLDEYRARAALRAD